MNTAPNCCTLTLLVVNAVSLSFQPDRVLSLCCVSTATDWGFGALLSVRLSLQAASSRRTSGRDRLRCAMRTLLQVECIQRPFGGHEHILAAAHGVRLRGVLDRADLGMPERHRGPPPPQAKGNQAPGSVVGEQQTARRREQTGATSAGEPVFPSELARPVIDRDDGRAERSHDVLLAASQPHEHARILVRQVIHRVDLAQHDIQESRPGIVARRIPVRRAGRAAWPCTPASDSRSRRCTDATRGRTSPASTPARLRGVPRRGSPTSPGPDLPGSSAPCRTSTAGRRSSDRTIAESPARRDRRPYPPARGPRPPWVPWWRSTAG